MSIRGFQHLPHTADVKVQAWGADLSTALVEAIRGFTSVLTDVSLLEATEQRTIAISAVSKEALFYDLITDLIYRKDVETFLASDASLRVWHEHSAWHLQGVLRGRCLLGHQLNDVKAMTYHELLIDEQPHKTTIEYVLDL